MFLKTVDFWGSIWLSTSHFPLSSLHSSVSESKISIWSVWKEHTHTHSRLGKSAESGSVEGKLKSSWQLPPLLLFLLSSSLMDLSPRVLAPQFISPPPSSPHCCPMDPIYHLSSALATHLPIPSCLFLHHLSSSAFGLILFNLISSFPFSVRPSSFCL